jgi:hypothetical protein
VRSQSYGRVQDSELRRSVFFFLTEENACFAFRASGLELAVAGGKREALPCTEPEQMVSGSQCLRGLVANRKFKEQ